MRRYQKPYYKNFKIVKRTDLKIIQCNGLDVKLDGRFKGFIMDCAVG